MLTIDVRGLPRSMTEERLGDLFSEHGKVFDLRLAKDIFSQQCKGVAEVKMEGHEARAACGALNGSVQDGEMVRVSVRSGRGGRAGHRGRGRR